MRLGLLSLLPLFVASSVAAEVPDIPDLTGVEVRTAVTPADGALRFEYRIDNTNGTLPVDGFSFPLASDASRAVVSIDGLDNSGDKKFSSAAYRAKHAPETYVAVAFPLQGEWPVGFDANRNARWNAGLESRVLQVGETRSGLVLSTRALPGIRQARLNADVLDLLPSELELDAAGLDPADLLAEVAASEQLMKVVAPVAPPAALDLEAFAREIEQLRAAAHAEGWIRTTQAAQSLASLLAQITSALAAGDNATAKRLTADFLDQVRAIGCTTFSCPETNALTAEGYALMRFNMEYLRSRIPNNAPQCATAAASPRLFWPPNHDLIDVRVVGVTDPDGDELRISIERVLSDEAVDTPGTGNTCPDAVIAADGALRLRAERAGKLDGRVYEVRFRATDPAGTACTGTVKVCMPHEESATPTCVEGPFDYDVSACP